MSIPSDIRAEALKAFANPQRVWTSVLINYDGDFCDFFVSPFLYRTWSEDNQISVAEVRGNEVIPIRS